METSSHTTFFAPELYINNGVKDISFYKNAFGATQNLCFTNEDGSIHVAELCIEGAIFHVHEITSSRFFSVCGTGGSITVLILCLSRPFDK